MKNIFAVMVISYISINLFGQKYDSLQFVTGGDTLMAYMGETTDSGVFETKAKLYVFPNEAQERSIYIKHGPFVPSASYQVLSSPDENTYTAYIKKLGMESPLSKPWSLRKKIGAVNYDITFWMIWPDSMKQTPKLSGADTICSNNKKYTFSIDSVDKATKYQWVVSPNKAGSFSDTGIVATLIPNVNYTGKIEVRAIGRVVDEFGLEYTPILSSPVTAHLKTCPNSIKSSTISPIEMTVYPNPASDFITVKTSSTAIGKTYTIVNVNGVILLSGEIINEQQTIAITSLSAGLYILKVEDKSMMINKE